MMRFIWPVLALLWCLPAHAQIGMTGITSKCTAQLPIDANGYTVFPTTHTGGSSATGKTYYVSSTVGNNLTAAADDVTKPWLTVAAAIAALTTDAGGNGNTSDSWLLLKKGDIFLDQAIGSAFGTLTGIDCLHPLVISSYDSAQPGTVNPYSAVATVASITCSSTTATVTTVAPHGWSQVPVVGPMVTITKELPAGFNGEFATTITGASTFTFPVASCPAASDTLHGIAVLDRPILAIDVNTQASCGPSDGGNGMKLFAFVGIKCYSYKSDPANASYDKTLVTKTAALLNTFTNFTWILSEDNASSFMPYLGTTVDTQIMGVFFSDRRNVNYYSSGNYVHGVAHYTAYQNYHFFDGHNPNLAAGQSVTVATGTPGVITWVNNPLVSGATDCSAIKFTGGTLPTGIVSGTQYYAKNVSGNTFNIATSCTATAIDLSGSPSGVVGYWQGTPSQGYAGIYPQTGNCSGGCTHSYYLQNGANSQYGTLDIQMSGNVVGFGIISVQGGGQNYENLFFQQASPLSLGKTGEQDLPNYFSATYNGVFEVAGFWDAPPDAAAASQGITAGVRAGRVTISHNLVAYESLPNAGFGVGIYPGGVQQWPSTSTVTNNIICSMTTPIQPLQGAPIALSPTVAGTGIAEVTGLIPYNSPYAPVGQGGIQVTGGSGFGAGLDVWVHGTSGKVFSTAFHYNMNGFNYRVGDVVSTANTYLGGGGSGWSGVVTAINGPAGISTIGEAATNGSTASGNNTLHFAAVPSWIVPGMTILDTGDRFGYNNHIPYGTTVSSVTTTTVVMSGNADSAGVASGATIQFLNGGSGYSANTLVDLTGGGGTGGQAIVTPGPHGCGANCGIQAVYPYTAGYGYTAGDVVNVTIAHTIQPTATINTVTTNTLSNNTFKAADCNNLQSATGSGGTGQPSSVAPPLTPSATPPTDVIGSYFQSLAYGYQVTVPTMLVGTSSGYEQGYMHQASLQQKANWDTNLMAHAVLNWARPQFGMSNP